MAHVLVAKLRSASFNVSRRGYDRDEVDGFLRAVAKELTDTETLALVGKAAGRALKAQPPVKREAEDPAAPSPEAAAPQEAAQAESIVAEAERRARAILADAQARAKAIGVEADATRRKVEDRANALRVEAERDAERLRAAAMASVREMVQLGKHQAVEELEGAFQQVDRFELGATSPTGRFDRAAWEDRRAAADAAANRQVA